MLIWLEFNTIHLILKYIYSLGNSSVAYCPRESNGAADSLARKGAALVDEEVPKIVKSINRQLREKSIKTKVVAFSVLRELVVVLLDSLADHIGSLIPGIEKALNVVVSWVMDGDYGNLALLDVILDIRSKLIDWSDEFKNRIDPLNFGIEWKYLEEIDEGGVLKGVVLNLKP
ncbi:hypothetical protein Q3G72_004201 [Acer saccharum]|nr:hypothetical protein Q3G72_004201 [Acer saccharum]